jgi:hypothetical protein
MGWFLRSSERQIVYNDYWDNGHRDNCFRARRFVKLADHPRAGDASMTVQSEFKLRAALCRKLAQREPANRTYWMAESDHWERLSKEELRDAEAKAGLISNRKNLASEHRLTDAIH